MKVQRVKDALPKKAIKLHRPSTTIEGYNHILVKLPQLDDWEFKKLFPSKYLTPAVYWWFIDHTYFSSASPITQDF